MAQLTTLRRWAQTSAAVKIGLIYIAARLLTVGFFTIATMVSGPTSRFGADASIGDFILGWDAQWYWYVVVNGYPSELPLTDVGAVGENGWAFMPGYAWLAEFVGKPFHSWGVGAGLVSLIAGYGACVMLYRLLRQRIDRSAAMWAVVFFACGPLAALFHVGYAETLFLFFFLAALDQLMRRRYDWLFVLIPLMGYTRPGVLAFSLTLGLYGIWRWFRRARDPLRVKEAVAIILLGLLGIVVGFSWQIIAGIMTGDMNSYLQTELAWRRSWLPNFDGHFLPFQGWWQAIEVWSGMQDQAGIGALPFALFLIIVPIAAVWIVFFDPRVRRLGIEPRLWVASYLLYLLAVFFPQSSVFRLLVPLTPLAGALALPRSRVWRFSVLGVCLVLQLTWIVNMYGLGDTFWRVP